MPGSGNSTVVVPPEQAPVFRRDGAYIITGGLGGLGLLLAGGMAAAGCGRIVLTGRSQPNARAEKAIARIRATGAEIQVECGNIAEPETAARLVAAATATGLPVRGVLHAAAVVGDATLADITDELIDRDWSSKVYGAWHLHRRRRPSRWTGSAPSPRQRRCSVHPARAPTRRQTAGWMPSPDGAAVRACRLRRSPGGRGTKAGGPLSDSGRTTMITPSRGRTRSRGCCATTGSTPDTSRLPERSGWRPWLRAAPSPKRCRP